MRITDRVILILIAKEFDVPKITEFIEVRNSSNLSLCNVVLVIEVDKRSVVR